MPEANPFDFSKKSKTEKNPFDFSGKSAAGKNPFDFSGAVKAVAGGASRLGDLLDAQRWAVTKGLTGESDTNKQMTKLRQAMGAEGAYRQAGEIPFVGHLMQGAADTAIQTATDPLTYETLGLGPILKGAKVGTKIAGALGKTSLGQAAGDEFVWGAKVGRELGPEAHDIARSASNKGSSVAAVTSKRMGGMVEKATKGLGEEDMVKVGQALNGEIDPKTLPQNLQRPYAQLRRLTELDYGMRNKATGGIKGVKELPKMEGGYLPGVHPKSPEFENRGAVSVDRINPFDPRTIERDPFKVEKGEQVTSGFEAMGKNLGRQMGASAIRDSLGELADKPQVRELFQLNLPAKGTERSAKQKVAEGIKAAVGYPRAAVVSMTPRHGANILDVLANTDPGALPEAMTLAAKLATADEKTYMHLTKDAREMGAISGEFLERKPFFSKVPVLGKWTSQMNKITWAVDDAAKQVYAKRIAAKGGNKLAAGGRASRELIDYANVSPFTEKARYVAPFATFRTGIPAAVLGGVARNPARAAALNRATGGTFYGGKSDGTQLYNPTADVGALNPGTYLRAGLGTPFQGAATVAEETLHEGPEQPLKSMVGAKPGKYADVVKLRADRFFTYGNPVDGKWLLNAAAAGIPEAQLILQTVGLGEFQARGLGQEALRQVFGVGLR